MNLRKFYLGRAIGFIVVVLLALIYFVFFKSKPIAITPTNNSSDMDVKNISYTINNETFSITFDLQDGKAESPIPESASKNILTMFGEPTFGDVDADGDQDAAVLLVNETGGSGLFYYAALAIKNSDGSYQATNSLLLGDRIAPQTVEIRDGQIIYNYADRKPDESMTAQPSIGQSLYVQYNKDSKQISIKPSEAVFCTMEAKECPDGSWVGRSGPNCEFAPCPSAIGGKITVGKSLDLSSQNLNELPKYVVNQIDLESLDISNNNLSGALPAEIRQLKNLKVLNISHNQFTGLPAEVGQLNNLEVLDLSYNKLTGLPYELGNLTKLKTLILIGNNYSEVDLKIIKDKLNQSVQIVEN